MQNSFHSTTDVKLLHFLFFFPHSFILPSALTLFFSLLFAFCEIWILNLSVIAQACLALLTNYEVKNSYQPQVKTKSEIKTKQMKATNKNMNEGAL